MKSEDLEKKVQKAMTRMAKELDKYYDLKNAGEDKRARKQWEKFERAERKYRKFQAVPA